MGDGALAAYGGRRPAFERPRHDRASHQRRRARRLAVFSGNRELLRERDLVVWAADGPAGSRWAAVFNLSSDARREPFDTRSLGLGSSVVDVVDVWSGSTLSASAVHEQSDAARGVAPGSTVLHLGLPPHGCVLLRSVD
ncbi:hypothetical protein [Microbacterium sp. C7(2022)]|uniref:hypothetical protein n=1 Tax=Microbacterium sp. C7(2022) TaxID=2992759 RepID=UPI00237B026B|nr:hypothetical protein [Microbacterium sp. C7(2022)]MDE0546650.1 hypothetical protein [Microbacterium sp. C7(2022)]